MTTYDNGVLQGQAYTAALYLPSAVLKEQVIRDTGKTLFCPPHRPTTVCTCWHGAAELVYGQRFPNRNGFSFVLLIHRALPANFWDDTIGSAIDADAGATSSSNFPSLTATPATEVRPTVGQVAQTPRPSGGATASTAHQRIDLHSTIAALETFDAYFFLPDLWLPAIGAWHPAFPWLSSWWDFTTPGSSIWIYYDGSCIKTESGPSTTAAAAAFICINEIWFFACTQHQTQGC